MFQFGWPPIVITLVIKHHTHKPIRRDGETGSVMDGRERKCLRASGVEELITRLLHEGVRTGFKPRRCDSRGEGFQHNMYTYAELQTASQVILHFNYRAVRAPLLPSMAHLTSSCPNLYWPYPPSGDYDPSYLNAPQWTGQEWQKYCLSCVDLVNLCLLDFKNLLWAPPLAHHSFCFTFSLWETSVISNHCLNWFLSCILSSCVEPGCLFWKPGSSFQHWTARLTLSIPGHWSLTSTMANTVSVLPYGYSLFKCLSALRAWTMSSLILKHQGLVLYLTAPSKYGWIDMTVVFNSLF